MHEDEILVTNCPQDGPCTVLKAMLAAEDPGAHVMALTVLQRCCGTETPDAVFQQNAAALLRSRILQVCASLVPKTPTCMHNEVMQRCMCMITCM